MKSLIKYISNKGIKRTISVLYHYKLDVCFQKIISFLLKKNPLQDVIIIESHNDFDCNGGAFYDYLLKHEYHKKYKIVWILKNKCKRKLPSNVKYFYLLTPSIRKAYYICRAKWLLADDVITQKQREDQKSIYLTHGAVGLKDVKGYIIVPDDVDYVLSPSKNFDAILSEQFSMSFPNDRMIHCGYPCHDVFYNGGKSVIHKITRDSFKKVILWMPTFRKQANAERNDGNNVLPYGIPLIENIQTYQSINEFLKTHNILLIVKLHPHQDLSCLDVLRETNNIKFLTGQDVKKLEIENYTLLNSVDALISDYSSIAYSFLLLNRPLGFVLSDLADYKLGLCVDNPDDYLVGEQIYSYSDLITFMKKIISGEDEYKTQRENLLKWLYKYQDGESCRRLVELMKL